eukprot:CAMPEP_0181203152 /NCGR_PEP_ID=MMETSP1096-20121128/19230_1 /TAXON_ID=156174 ORGANISM="Chrysochromulina ericina, Strain CCMP281" /NCGR_SAMPLE_ID=MMETSP1096 /ASSEMBLY_ACC=CAM_ASM_000453 /LENGTH=444 /DNA_ID=CAMNT_0023293727 /DNA_START=136 /DNA_END=1467 /DNA_ORIENTATION=+
MRSIFMQNDKLDGWAFWGYGMRRMPAVASVLRLALLNKSTSCSSWAHRSPLRIAAELHYGNTLGPLEDSLMRYFGPASPLRQIAMRCTCKVVLVTRLRDPLSMYTSYWKWARLPQKQHANQSTWGATMIEWASFARNLQSSLLLGGSMLSATSEYIGVRHPRAPAAYSEYQGFDEPSVWKPGVHPELDAVGAARVMLLRRMLLSFDLVGLVERFEETLLLVADLVGLQHLLHPISNEGVQAYAVDNTMLGCEDEAKCRSLIHAIAPVDTMIYREMQAVFAARVGVLGAPFAERVAALRAARAQRLVEHAGWIAPFRKYAKPPSVASVDIRNISCQGMLEGEGATANDLCRFLRADTEFDLKWRHVQVQGRKQPLDHAQLAIPADPGSLVSFGLRPRMQPQHRSQSRQMARAWLHNSHGGFCATTVIADDDESEASCLYDIKGAW